MEHHKLVLPGHMNQHGFLFGGELLQWIDEFAWITATVDYPGLRFVTVAMDNVQFRKGIDVGEVLRFVVERVNVGQTSVRYRVRAHGIVRQPDPATVLFETTITFVNLDAAGNKAPLPG
ncbi:MAG: acyl-CoA thioesterase [Gammaproteobacteria bacterium]|nr:acyl-CoA thioesterase [Gammaproteobacteria bacterium]